MTPRQVGHYRLGSLLGSGGTGEVYEAYDTARDRDVALKLLPAAFSGDQEYLKRFQAESEIAARLREPHVIPIHDFGEIDGQLFIDMRLVDGTDVGAMLKTSGRITPHRAVYLISQVAEALDAAHADGLVHRDIKPSNILVTSSDFVYVVDFGVARSTGGTQPAPAVTGATIGALRYMAPERLADRDVDGRADVYSLACVLHECLTGAPPFTGVPPALDAVIARGMAKNPGDRFATAGAMAAAARQAVLTGAPPSPSPPPPPPPATEPPALAWTGTLEPGGTDSPTQTVTAAAAGDWGGVQPEDIPQVTGPDPDGGRLPPGEVPGGTAGGPDWRRRGALLLLAAAALAIPLVIVLFVSGAPASSGPAAATSTQGATGTATAGAAGGVPAEEPPTSGGKITVGPNPSYIQVAPNGQFAYVTHPGTGVISVLDTATDRLAGTIKIPQGPPQFVSFSPDSRTAYVSLYNPGNSAVHLIAFIDTATRTVTATVPADNFTPGPSMTSPDGRYLYVPNHNTAMTGAGENVVDVIDTASRKLTGHIAVPADPHWVACGKDGRIYTTDHMSAAVTVLSAATNSIITEIRVGETPHSEALSPDGSRLAVTSFAGNVVFLINTVTDQMIATIPVGRNPVDIAYSRNGDYLYTVNNEDNSVTVIGTAGNRVLGTVKTGKAPTSISVLPNGRQAYVSDENDGTVEILNLPR